MMGHLQETYPYERHFLKITNKKFYIQFPLNHAPRMRTKFRQDPRKIRPKRNKLEDTTMKTPKDDKP